MTRNERPSAQSRSLAGSNSLGVACVADRVVEVRADHQLAPLIGKQAVTVLGGGSNVVLLRRVSGTVCLMRTRGFDLRPAAGGSAVVTAAAGERWHDLVRFTLAQGYAGLENLALIPGSVGAAPIQNIGAYGVELADRFVGLEAMDMETGRVHDFDLRECHFGYRDSVFKASSRRWIVLRLTLRLDRNVAPRIDYPDLRLELERAGWSKPKPVQVAEAVIRVRRRKLPDPRFVGNVGSFFKNPQTDAATAAELCRRHPFLQARPGSAGRAKLSAAQLIDACGWKGRRVGAAAVWHRQPLVLVNLGGATGRDVLALSEDIRADVARRFGVALELEPRVVGQDSD